MTNEDGKIIIANCRVEIVHRQVTFKIPTEEDRMRAALELELARAEAAIRRAARVVHHVDAVDALAEGITELRRRARLAKFRVEDRSHEETIR